MLWHIIRYGISLLLPTFYSRIQAKNMHRLHQKGPAVVAMNHPNAFTDPIAITYVCYPLRTWYMARGDAFRPGLISALLENIGIVPIFRIQDGGREGLKKNDEAYRRVNRLLLRRRKVIVFAEGICVQERRVRPLKKGVARMVFGASALPGNEELLVYPVGIHYSQPNAFRSTVFYQVGEPLCVKDFWALHQENPAKAHKQFLQELETRMKDLIAHIDHPQYDNAVYYAETLQKQTLLTEKGLNAHNLAHDFEVVKDLTGRVNRAASTQPALVNAFMQQGSAYFQELRGAGLEDWVLDPAAGATRRPRALALRWLLLLLGAPLHLAGLAGNYLPLKICEQLAGKVAKKKEFYSSMWLGFGIVVFPAWYLCLFFLVYRFSDTVLPPLVVLLTMALAGWFSLHYLPFFRATRVLAKARRQPALLQRLGAQRSDLVAAINKF